KMPLNIECVIDRRMNLNEKFQNFSFRPGPTRLRSCDCCANFFVATALSEGYRHDKLRSYRAALRKLGFSGLHQQGLRANNRRVTSYEPNRRRERKMQGFKSARFAQRFVSIHSAVYNTFNVQRHLISRPTHRRFRTAADQCWGEATAAAA